MRASRVIWLFAVLSLVGCRGELEWTADAGLGGNPDAAVVDECGACTSGELCAGGRCFDPEWANWPVPKTADSNYTVTDDTVTDRTTGLVWQRNVGAIPASNWADAKEYCASLTLGGSSGWRLPTRIELLSIRDASRANPAINPDTFPETPSEYFWSSSRQAGSSTNIWCVNFQSGLTSLNGDDPGTTSSVRCVR